MSGAARKADSKKRLMLDVRSRLTGDRRRRPSSRRAKEIAATSGDPSHRYSETGSSYFAMARKSDFRRKAKACAWLAQRAHDPGVKARYAIVADEWLALAESPAKGLGRSARQKGHLGRKLASR
jgi:hypothetical protein